jgi:protein-disulfide isomerase
MHRIRNVGPLGAVLVALATTAAAWPGRAHADPAGAAGPDPILALADSGRIQGRPSATVWLVEASDFECPYCKEWHDATYATILKHYVNTGKVRFAFLNDPLHPHSEQAAEAAMCASAQQKFWPMHEALFATQEQWAEQTDPAPLFDSLAAKAGVNLTAWRRCVATHATRPMIQADQARLRASGVQSTPTFFVNGKKLVGAAPTAVFVAALDSALAKSHTP